MRAIAAFLLVSLTAGCKDPPPPSETRPGSSGAPTPSAAAAAPTLVVEPKVAALALPALSCAPNPGLLDPACPGMHAWAEAVTEFKDGKEDSSLVAMLADPNDKMRYLGAFKLNQYGRLYRTNRALAVDIVAAAEKETSPLAAFELGTTVGRLSVKSTGTFDRIRPIVTSHPLPDLRRGVLAGLLYNNSLDQRVFDLVRDNVKDPNPAVGLAALRAFWTGGSGRAEATCEVYLHHANDPNPELAAEASNALGWFGRCSAHFDALLDSLEKRVKSGAPSLGSPSFPSAARHVCEDTKSNDEQKKRGAVIGRDIAAVTTLVASVRIAGLDTLARCDPSDAGRRALEKFKGDQEKVVADKAKELLGKH